MSKGRGKRQKIKTAQRYVRNAAIADLGKIAENIREPYQGVFDEESAGENDRTGLNEYNSEVVVDECLESIMDGIEPCKSLFDESLRENNKSNFNKYDFQLTNDESSGLVMNDIREPCESLFDEESAGKNDKAIPEENVAGKEGMQEREVLSSPDKGEMRQNNQEMASKKDIEDTNDESLGKIMDDIREPYNGLFDEACKEEKTAGKETADQNQAEVKIKETPDRHYGNVEEVMQILLQQNLVLCMNGKHLLVKEDGYIPISVSAELEIMHLKKLLRIYDWKLNPSEYKTIIKELKTEPDIWVENIEMKDGKYDISFCGGNILRGVYGEFDDYMIQGQMYTKRKPFTKGILSFVNECCEISTSVQVGSSELFYAYQSYMAETADYLKAKQNQFVPFLISEYGVFKGSTGKKRTLIGICLRGEHLLANGQDVPY